MAKLIFWCGVLKRFQAMSQGVDFSETAVGKDINALSEKRAP